MHKYLDIFLFFLFIFTNTSACIPRFYHPNRYGFYSLSYIRFLKSKLFIYGHIKVAHSFVRMYTSNTQSNRFSFSFHSRFHCEWSVSWFRSNYLLIFTLQGMKWKCHVLLSRKYLRQRRGENESETRGGYDDVCAAVHVRNSTIFEHNLVHSMKKKCHIARGESNNPKTYMHTFSAVHWASSSANISTRQHHLAHGIIWTEKKQSFEKRARQPLHSW